MLAFWQKRTDFVLAALLGFAALAVYLRTLCPTIYWGDCGELAAAAYTLGIAHPTGYPVWTMAAKLWSLVFPLGTFIWRLNVLSALIGAVAVGGVFHAARALGVSRPAALMCGGVFAFSSTFWQQCLFAETYSLTACYCAVLLALAFRWRARGCRPADLSPLAVVYGFAMTNGQINTLFLPGFLAFVLWSDPHLRGWRAPHTRRVWLRLAVLACLPLLSYAYLPIRALARPAVNWGDPRTPFAFWYHVTGRLYAPLMFHSPPALVRHVFLVWARNLNGEFAWPLVGLAVYGLTVLARRMPPGALLLGWVMGADVVFTINYPIYNHYIYFLPCYLALALLFGVGADSLVQKAALLASPPKKRGFQAVGAACLLLLVPFQAVAHWERNDLHEAWACYDYGHNLLASAPPRSILADNGEDTSHFAMCYLQTVEGFRPDVTLVQCQFLDALYDPHYRCWANRWYWDQITRRDPLLASLDASHAMTPREMQADGIMRRLVPRALAARRPLLIAGLDHKPMMDNGHGRQVPMQDYLTQRYGLASVGLLARVYPAHGLPAPAVLHAQTEAVWSRYRLRGLSGGLYQQDEFLIPLLMQYADAALVRARLAYAQGDYDTAEASYHFVLQLFSSGEAAVGLDKCAEARARRKRMALLTPSP